MESYHLPVAGRADEVPVAENDYEGAPVGQAHFTLKATGATHP